MFQITFSNIKNTSDSEYTGFGYSCQLYIYVIINTLYISPDTFNKQINRYHT